MTEDVDFMKLALVEADRAANEGNMGCGAIIVRDGEVVSIGRNTVATSGDPTNHAEVDAVRQATSGGREGAARGATLYTTMEPCPMCMWAILLSGVARLVIGCRHADLEPGVRTDLADYSTEKLLALTGRNIVVESGVLREACEEVRRRVA